MRFFVILSACAVLVACSPPRPRPIPPVVDPVGMREQGMGCEQLLQEIQQARQTYQAAEANVGFEWWDLTLIHVPYSWYKSERSEWAAEDRLEQLQALATQRGCAQAAMTPPPPPQNWQATPPAAYPPPGYNVPQQMPYPSAPAAGYPPAPTAQPPGQAQDSPWGQRGQVNLP